MLAAFAATLLAAAPGQNRVAVLVVGSSPALEGQAGQFQGAIEDDLGRSHALVRWADLVGQDAPALAALDKLRQLTAASLSSCSAQVGAGEGSRADEAIAALQAAAPAMTSADVQRAYAALAAQRWVQNQPTDAEVAAQQALAIDPGFPPPQVTGSPGFDELWARARFSSADKAKTAYDISTEPAGARILIDGTFRGFSPTSVSGLSQGAHLLQLERVGYRSTGFVVTLAGLGNARGVQLVPAPGWSNAQVLAAVDGAAHKAPGPAFDLAAGMHVDALVLGALTPRRSGTLLTLVAVRGAERRLLGTKELPFDADEYGQASRAATIAAGELLEGKVGGAHAEETKKASKGDPLDSHDGTEDW
ncbi:MAG: PEGA domain-containing protein [Deltaproteobacteria bacterium]